MLHRATKVLFFGYYNGCLRFFLPQTPRDIRSHEKGERVTGAGRRSYNEYLNDDSAEGVGGKYAGMRLSAEEQEVRMVEAIRHYMNPLHVYCRLRDVGVSKGLAVLICRIYERLIFKYFLTR
jgi:hypothetical protein